MPLSLEIFLFPWKRQTITIKQKLRGKDPTVIPVDRLGIPTYNELVLVANSDRLDDQAIFPSKGLAIFALSFVFKFLRQGKIKRRSLVFIKFNKLYI